MDKLIKKIAKEVPKKSKASKDLKVLAKADKKMDSKMSSMKKKGC